MKKFTFFLAAILFAGVCMAEVYTHTFAEGDLGDNKTLTAGNFTLSGVEWTVEHEGGEYAGWDGNQSAKGIQIGKGGVPCTSYVLKTSAFNGTIKKVVVNTSVASKGVSTVSISVGETSYLADQSLTTTATDYSGTGSASGDLKISLANTGEKAMYIKSIKVEYGDASAPSISADDIDFGRVDVAKTNTQTLTVTGENLTDAITATLKEGTAFSVASSLTATGGELVITLTAKAAGKYTDVLTLKSGETTKDVSISAEAIQLTGEGTAEKPYTVADVIGLALTNATEVWVQGYIVGTMVSNALSTSTADAVASNLVLADIADATTNYIPVQLPSGAEVRTALNLIDNPTMLGAKVAILGKLELYFSIPGLKSPTDYKIISTPATALDNITVENKATKTIINGQVLIIREGKTFTLMGQEVK